MPVLGHLKTIHPCLPSRAKTRSHGGVPVQRRCKGSRSAAGDILGWFVGPVSATTLPTGSTALSTAYSAPRTRPNCGDTYIVPVARVHEIGTALRLVSVLLYAAWAHALTEQTGPLVHVEAFNTHVFIVNSLKIARELFEKRSLVYSSRPWVPMFELTELTDFVVGQPYGEEWRWHRRTMDKQFRRESAKLYRSIHTQKIHAFLRRLNDHPEDFAAHVRALPGATIMSTVYGYDVPEYTQDRFIEVAEEYNRRVTVSFTPGAQIVDFFPFLRHFPAWVPGCGFQKSAQEIRALKDEVKNQPFGYALEHKALVKMLEEAQAGTDDEMEMLRRVSGVSYSAASDTTVSALMTFFLAMALYPAIQRKAQTEIDDLLGAPGGKFPTFEHKASLPYVEAVLREVLCWRPVLPLSVPHATSAEDDYGGYFIPKETTVVMNIWALTHEESTYGSDPNAFNPDRFLKPDGTLLEANHTSLAFGLGPRICPGRFYAEDVLWLTFVSVLAFFDIGKAMTTEGVESEVDAANPPYSDTTISHPLPFKCSIKPRSTVVKDLLGGVSLQE
ncbi:Cytochrome P450 [Mycena chlorophos]|uniref:Cytochrome P450 n=1 Tax=Mycena chlorophos TaxID=658473 RepID=A0A8H6VP05_MYCCL|nr:Cytochrome P450 [Mycena chlorophos]